MFKRFLALLPFFAIGLLGLSLSQAERETQPSDSLTLEADPAPAPDAHEDTRQKAPHVVRPEVSEINYSNTAQSIHETLFFIQTLERMHLRNKMLSEVPAKNIVSDPKDPESKVLAKGMIEAYASELDPNALFFTQDSIDKFRKRFAASIHLYLYRGTIDPGVSMFKEFKKKALDRLDWVIQRLDEPFDLESTELFDTDRSKAPWETSTQALDDVWERRLLSELISELLPLIDPMKEEEDEEAPAANNPTQQQEASSEDPEEAHQEEDTPSNAGGADVSPKDEATSEDKITSEDQTAPTQENKKPREPLSLEEAMPKAIESLKKRFNYWRSNIEEISFEQVQEIFLTSIAQLYDSHSSFFSADAMDNLSTSLHNVLVGIGAMLLDEDGYCTIKDLVPGGPAHLDGRIGLEDKILAVGQGQEDPMVDVVGMKTTKIVKLIRGEENTEVRLLIQPANADRSMSKEIVLERRQIELTANLARAKLFEFPLESTNKAAPEETAQEAIETTNEDPEPQKTPQPKTLKLGYIYVPSFYGSDQDKGNLSSVEDVDELISRLKDLGMDGLILDLRYNGGGILQEGIALAGLFVPAGPIMQAKNTLGQTGEYADSSPYVAWNGPMIVLGNRYSASASEIVIGALMDYSRALFVGDKTTHGKGSVQGILNTPTFPGGLRKEKSAAAKITVQQYYRLNGESTQLRGVASDITLPSLNDLLPVGEDALSNPVPWDQIRPIRSELLTPEKTPSGRTSFKPIQDADWNRFPVTEDLIAQLRQKSLERQETLEEFSVFEKNIEWARQKHDRKQVSLNLEERKLQRQKDFAFIRENDERLKALVPEPYPHQELLLKLAQEKEKEREALDKHLKKGSKSDSDKAKAVDIPLRESLRILQDWLQLPAPEA